MRRRPMLEVVWRRHDVACFTRLRLDAQDGSHVTAGFIDTSVYSRNRAFRLFLSSKAGKQSVLLPTGDALAPQLSRHDQ